MLKKMLSILCFVILITIRFMPGLAETFLFPIEPAAVSSEDITLQAALSIAKQMHEKQSGSRVENMENYFVKTNCVWLETNEKAWTIMLDEKAYGVDSLSMINAKTGEPLFFHSTSTEITSYLVEQWSKEKGAMRTWSVEDKALFNWLYGATEEYIVPNAQFITKDEATSIALSAISEIVPDPSYTYAFQKMIHSGAEEYVWMVTIYSGGIGKYLVTISANDGTVHEVYELSSNG